MNPKNIFANIPEQLREELFEVLIDTPEIKMERIVSKGHVTPEDQWYDQDKHEWVLLLQGEATLKFYDGKSVLLSPGDYVNIPAHVRHRVEKTSTDEDCIWLAVFYT